MPFDLDRTTHVFKTTDTGGIETVIAKDAADSEQIALIQQHLQHEAMQFRAGDFGAPATIHGATMPGLSELAAGAANMTFSYAALSDGAQISYATNDPILVDALHRWFAAQLADLRDASAVEGRRYITPGNGAAHDRAVSQIDHAGLVGGWRRHQL